MVGCNLPDEILSDAVSSSMDGLYGYCFGEWKVGL